MIQTQMTSTERTKKEPLEEDVNTEFNILRESTGKRRDLILVINLKFILSISPLVAGHSK